MEGQIRVQFSPSAVKLVAWGKGERWSGNLTVRAHQARNLDKKITELTLKECRKKYQWSRKSRK